MRVGLHCLNCRFGALPHCTILIAGETKRGMMVRVVFTARAEGESAIPSRLRKRQIRDIGHEVTRQCLGERSINGKFG